MPVTFPYKRAQSYGVITNMIARLGYKLRHSPLNRQHLHTDQVPVETMEVDCISSYFCNAFSKAHSGAAPSRDAVSIRVVCVDETL